MSYVIGLDLGGTQLRAALVDEQGTVVHHQRIPTRGSEGPEAVISRMVGLIQAMRDWTEEPILGVGVGAPGPLDPTTGVVITAPNLPGWNGLPLRALLQERTDLQVQVGNDANVAALSEWLFGAAHGLQNVIYVTISTGIGGGIITDGRLLLGRKGLAAEVGHMAVMPDGPICGCGNRGCWEAVASGTALARIAAQELAGSERPSLLRELEHAGPVTAAHVTAAAQRGDELACELLQQEGFYLGVGIVSLLHLFSPDMIVLGGGVTNSWDLIYPSMRDVVMTRAITGYRDVPIVRTALGDEIGVLGAAALVFYSSRSA